MILVAAAEMAGRIITQGLPPWLCQLLQQNCEFCLQPGWNSRANPHRWADVLEMYAGQANLSKMCGRASGSWFGNLFAISFRLKFGVSFRWWLANVVSGGLEDAENG